MFLRPGWLLLGMLLPLIVLLYFKKRQSLEYRVSWLEFWEEAVREKAGIKINQIDRYLPLALQLALGALLALAAAGPLWVQQFTAERVTLALDCSISMRAAENGTTRFDLAKGEIMKIIRKLPSDSRISIVFLKDGAEERIRDADKQHALQVVEKAECGLQALNLAQGSKFLAAYPAPVIVATDKELDWGGCTTVRVGGSLENAGITRASFDYYSEKVLFTVKNYSPSGSQITVGLWNGNQKIDAARIKLPAGEESGGSFQVPEAAGMLAVKIEDEDMLEADNIYLVAAGDLGRKKVLLGREDLYLQKALAAAADVKLDVAGSAGDTYEQYDVVITGDESDIAEISPQVGVWLLQAGGERQAKGEAHDIPLELRQTSLTEGLSLKNAVVKYAGRLEEKEGFQTVMEAGGEPVMAYGIEKGRRTVCSALNWEESNLVRQPVFPVLVSNVVNWLQGDEDQITANPPAAMILGEESGMAAGKEAENRPLNTNLESILLAAALLLLVAEWEVYKRGI